MASLMALKCSQPALDSTTVRISHMRNSAKLLLGLVMPGLALAAIWLWTSRRARQQERSHGNDTEMKRELRSVAEEMKKITRNGCTNHNAAKIFNYSAKNNCGEVTNDSKQETSLSREGSDKNTSVNTKLENLDNLSGIALTQEGLVENSSCAENDGALEFSNISTTESSEFFRNSRTGNLDERGNSTGDFAEMSHRSNSCIENEATKDSEKTSDQNERRTVSPKASDLNFDPSQSMNNKGDTECSCSKAVNETTEVSSDATASQKAESISKVITKAPTVRVQSLDESSDISSVDSKADSPLDQKLNPTVGSDSEPAQPEEDTAEEITWELEFPQALCGRLIGKKGKNVQKISQITGTKIRLIPQKENTECSQRLVALTGSPKQLELALKALREKFPSVPFTRLNGNQPFLGGGHVSPTPNITCVALPEHEICQVFVTNIVDANHFYVQLFDQSVHTHLRQLDQQMYQCYGGVARTMVPQTINTGMLCAALSPRGWWRAQVVGLLMNPDEIEITWLDYGGRTTVATAMLRQLRSDFLHVPFQAVECYLSNVVPNHGEPQFSMAACALFEQLTQSVIVTARITGYTRDCPNLELYVSDQWTGQSLFVNRELVRRGFARWSET